MKKTSDRKLTDRTNDHSRLFRAVQKMFFNISGLKI